MSYVRAVQHQERRGEAVQGLLDLGGDAQHLQRRAEARLLPVAQRIAHRLREDGGVLERRLDDVVGGSDGRLREQRRNRPENKQHPRK